MTAEIVKFPGMTVLDTDPLEILELAKSWGMRRTLIIGEDDDDRLVVGGSFSSKEKAIFLMELLKHKLLNGDYG